MVVLAGFRKRLMEVLDDQRRQKHRRNSDPDDEAMPVLVVNAPVPPPPQFLRADGGGAMGFAADEHDHLAQLADAMFPDVGRVYQRFNAKI